MIEIFVYSPIIGGILWFFVLRPLLRKKNINSTGADYFQAFTKDLLEGFKLARNGNMIIAAVMMLILLSVIISVLSIITMVIGGNVIFWI